MQDCGNYNALAMEIHVPQPCAKPWGQAEIHLLAEHPGLGTWLWEDDSLYSGANSRAIHRWVSARLQYLQCVSSGDTAVLHWPIDMFLENDAVHRWFSTMLCYLRCVRVGDTAVLRIAMYGKGWNVSLDLGTWKDEPLHIGPHLIKGIHVSW